MAGRITVLWGLLMVWSLLPACAAAQDVAGTASLNDLLATSVVEEDAANVADSTSSGEASGQMDAASSGEASSPYARYRSSPMIVIEPSRYVDGAATQPAAPVAPIPSASTAITTTTTREAPITSTVAAPTAAAPASAPSARWEPNFPAVAVTHVGEIAGGQTPLQRPASPSSPLGAARPSSPASVDGPNRPLSPPAPAAPVDALWPKDTVPIFMRSCVGLNPALLPGCGCVIGHLMVEIPHDEFLRLSENEKIEQDPRLMQIRRRCIGTPTRKDDQ